MFGLGFLAPAFLAGLLAVAVPIALHLYRRRTDKVIEFPAAQMLPASPVARQERRRLRDLLLLALRVAALVLLAVSFARPYLATGDPAVGGGTTIVAVDVSLSTSAPATWAELKRRATAAVAGAPAADLVGVVAFDDRGHLVVAPSADRDEARAAIDALVPGAGGTRYAAGVGAAVEALRGGRGRIVVVTDLQQRGWQGAERIDVPGGVDVSVAAVPAAPANLAVTAVRHDEGLTAVVQNYASGPRSAVARLRVDGAEITRATVTLAPLSASDVRFSAALPPRGVAEVTIDDPDGFQGDNARYWLLEPPRPVTVVVLTADPPESATTGLYVQRALEAAAETWPMRVVVEDGRRFSAAGGAEAPDALIIVGTRTLDRRGRERLVAYLRDGGRVLLSLGPDVDVPTLGDALGVAIRLLPDPVVPPPDEAAIIPSDRRHPVWRQLAGSRSALGRLPIDRYRQVLDDTEWDVLARFAGGAVAFAERHVSRGTLLLFASDLDNRWNRFPLEPGFAPFIAEIAQYLTRDARTTTAFVLPDVPTAVPAVPGAHARAAGPGRPAATVVVNIDPAESDPTPGTAEAFTSRVQTAANVASARPTDEARTREAAQRLWQIGLVAMLAILVIESLVGRVSRPRRDAETG
ncbi:MAG: BatA domain-containing protein [Acidobacteria bacterium]|nr:BatA domain-containing protein [Acidobacteriota bacterium]